jgi:hypothetical protein
MTVNIQTKILFILVLLGYSITAKSENYIKSSLYDKSLVVEQIKFEPNNTETWICNNGLFNQDIRYTNTPGFQWPKNSNKFAIFSSGLILAGFVNGQFKIANGLIGEFAPGYITIISGVPVAQTDSRFKFYKVSRGDNMYNNTDWANWGLMVPYGAPYVDVNSNNIYEPAIDTPGVKNASQTIFICLTDGFIQSHAGHEGFGGGTQPLFAEAHLTAWGYDNIPGLEDVQFLKWDIINKNVSPWNSTYFGLYYDPDLGCPDDDFIGCDSTAGLGFCYNGDNEDAGCIHAYGSNPPAVGIKWLRCVNNTLLLNSFVPQYNIFQQQTCGPWDPYNSLRGFKNDGSWWLNPKVTQGSRKTKFVFSGDPESGIGWFCTDSLIDNCGGDTTGNLVQSHFDDFRFVLGAGNDNLTINPNEVKAVMIAQLIARGSSNLNSVTKLKLLSNHLQNLCDSGFLIGVNNISSVVPNSFYLYQNYPNPFNPVTKLKFNIPPSKGARGMIRLVIYDVQGCEVAVLVNELLKPGSYEAEWDGTNYPSGVYFYKFVTDGFSETKKMVLIK